MKKLIKVVLVFILISLLSQSLFIFSFFKPKIVYAESTSEVVYGHNNFKDVAAGYYHSIGLKEDGTVWTWGHNNGGQLGDGTLTTRKTPVETENISNVKAIEVGRYHSMALKNDGTVWTWGANNYGVLGDGTTTRRSIPVQTLNLSDVKSIAAGEYHCLAIKNDGTVWAWGHNRYGQLGDGTTTDRSIPVQLANLNDVKAVSAGQNHSIAVKNDGTVWAWGYNGNRQLGDGTTTSSSVPVQTVSLSNVKSVAAGDFHSIALKNNGTVWAWGYNSNGQLGDGTTTDSSVPVQTAELSDVNSITGGNRYSIALKSDGTVWAWGYNSSGQLGDGTTTTRLSPIHVQNLSGVYRLEAGYEHSIVLKSDGTVWTWGYNYHGELGDGTTNSKSTPIPVTGLSSFIDVAAGSGHSIALKNDGTVWAWGSNSHGRLGDGTTTNSSIPVQVVNLSDVKAIAAGYNHSIALKNDGTVWAWGYNSYGLLGDGTTTASSIPVQAVGLSEVKVITAGGFHSMALKNDGTVWAWGRNNAGQLGIGSTSDRSTPTKISGINDVKTIAAGEYYSLALKNDGTVWAWGSNSVGQLGDGTISTRTTPVQVTNLNNIKAIAAGAAHSIAVKHDGTVWAWGYNNNGQLGDGTITKRYIPVQTSSLSGAKSVEAGKYHSIALKHDGTVWAWGYNSYGELGDGTTIKRYAPVQTSNLSDIVSVVLGEYHSIALKNDGTVWVWGYNNSGQLGDGTNVNSNIPQGIYNTSPTVTSVLNNSNLELSYTPVGGTVRYEIDINGTIINNALNTTYTIGDIDPKNTDTFRVRSVNSTSNGLWSVNAPTNCTYSWTSETKVTAFWEQNNNPTSVEYVLAAFDENNNIVSASVWTKELSTSVSGLNENEEFLLKVKAKNTDGVESAWVPVNIPVVENLSAEVIDDSIRVTWDKLSEKYKYHIIKDGEHLYNGFTENSFTINVSDNELKDFKIRALIDDGDEFTYGNWASVKCSLLGEARIFSMDSDSLKISFNANAEKLIESSKIIIDENDYTDWLPVQNNENIYRIANLNTENEYNIKIKCIANDIQYYVFDENIKLNPLPKEFVQVTINQGNNIEIAWQPINGASGYDIMRNNEIIVRNVKSLVYQDIDADITKANYYRVKPIFLDTVSSNTSLWSDPATYVPENYKLETTNSGQAMLKNNQIEVSWPAVSGAINYIIKVDNNSIVDLQNNSTNFIDKLSDIHKKHIYQIQTVYGNGENRIYSDFGAPIVYNPKLSYPGEVTNGYAYLGENGYINLQWKAANPADEYEIKINNGDNFTRTNTTSLVITSGADVKDNHVIQVRAICIDGLNKLYGEWSTPIEYIAPQTKPDKVSGLNVQVTSKKITLNWNSSERADQYEIEMNGKMVAITNGLVHIHSSCDNDIPYIFRIRAKNEGGYSAWVTSEIVVIPKPEVQDVITPTQLRTKVENTKVSLYWDSVSGAESYKVSVISLKDGVEDTTRVMDSGVEPYSVVSGLIAGNEYLFNVSAVNSGYTSQPASTGVIATKLLSTPKIEVAEPGSLEKTIYLKWDEVVDASTYTISIDDGEQINLIETSETSKTITDLQHNTSYVIKIKANNLQGESSFSSERVIYTWADYELKNINAIASKRKVHLSWDPISSAPQGYEVEVDGIIIDNGLSTNYLYLDLEPYSQHTFRVRARYSDITSNWSDTLTVFTLPDLTIYPNNIIISTDALPEITWDSLQGAIGYRVEIDGSKVINNGDSTIFVHRQRLENKEYYYRVQAYYPYGDGNWSPRLVNNCMRANVNRDEYLMLGLTGEHIVDFNKYTLTVSYNPGVLKVYDLSAMSAINETSIGNIAGTSITVTEFKPGYIAFEVENTHDENYAWTGVLNSIKFVGNMDGGTYINYTVYEKEDIDDKA